MTFTLTAQMPSGKNQVQITRTGQHYPTARFVAWRRGAEAEVLRQVKPAEKPLTGRLALTVCYTPADRRVRDVSGLLDALFHLLARCGLLLDDGQIRDVTWRERAGTPGVVVRLEASRG